MGLINCVGVYYYIWKSLMWHHLIGGCRTRLLYMSLSNLNSLFYIYNAWIVPLFMDSLFILVSLATS